MSTWRKRRKRLVRYVRATTRVDGRTDDTLRAWTGWMDEDGDLPPTDDPWMRSSHFSFIRVRCVACVRTRGWVVVDRGDGTRDCGRVSWEEAWEVERRGDGLG